MNTKFQAKYFSNGAVYVCRSCGKKTREIGLDESSVELCARCYVEATLENSLSDGNITENDFAIKMRKLNKAKTGSELEVIYDQYASPETEEDDEAKPKKAARISGMPSMLSRIDALNDLGFSPSYIEKTIAEEYGKDEKTAHARLVVWYRKTRKQ